MPMINWEDPTKTRWSSANVYGGLQINDNVIFIGTDKLFVGVITQLNQGQTMFCSSIREVSCTNDQFLQLHEIYPELISRVKANFQPFIHPREVNIQQLIADATAKSFVSYYLLLDVNFYNQSIEMFQVNDRIILINSDNKLGKIQLNSEEGLVDFPSDTPVSTSVGGWTLDEMLDKNKSIKRKSIRPNNVKRIEDIKKVLKNSRFYKFKTFFSYYDCLYNKRVYNYISSSDAITSEIELLENENVFKVSMGGNTINEEAFNYFNEANLIAVHAYTKPKGTSWQSQGATFSKEMKIGDYFYLCRGNSNLEVIGQITGEATACEYENWGYEDDWLQRPYKVIREAQTDRAYAGDKKWWTPNDNSTCIIIPKNEIEDANDKIFRTFFNVYFKRQKNTAAGINIKHSIMSSTILNQILYGPPGTGKTYNTINKALEILGYSIEERSRRDLKQLFDAKVKTGQIAFTTFHQSMSYEDFMEGIKPIPPKQEGGLISYKVIDGIFKTIAINAKKNQELAELREDNELSAPFELLFDKLKSEIENALLNDPVEIPNEKQRGLVLNLPTSFFSITGVNGTSIKMMTKTGNEQNTMTKPTLQRIYEDPDSLEQIITGGMRTYYRALVSKLKDWEKDVKTTAKEVKLQNYVLIIDEINRGNVSQIFGELITLIEDDKRLGNSEALEATLPYSKEQFGVPANLYIIGTMNTADRSVEALDAALRRRFCFEEMPPQPALLKPAVLLKNLWIKYSSLKWNNAKWLQLEKDFMDLHGEIVDREKYEAAEADVNQQDLIAQIEQAVAFTGINLEELLTTINKRIEKLTDKDHKIGHSYFIHVASLRDLQSAFQFKIIPLLQEYFFGDYGKIGLVLGQDFFEPIEKTDETLFATFGDYDASGFAERPSYKLRNIGTMDTAAFKAAISTLLKK